MDVKRIFNAVPSRHEDLAKDLVRILCIQIMIHLMLCAEGSEKFANRSMVSLLLYTSLGIAFYHLLAKEILLPAQDSTKSVPSVKLRVPETKDA